MSAASGLAAVRTARPGSAAQLAALVAEAREARLGLIPVGGGTELHVGNPPARCDLAVETGGLAWVATDYSPADLVLTVGAGTALSDVQAFLADHGQRLPLEGEPGATAGGTVAAATSGKRRLSCGSPRDWLVGLQAVAGTGATIRAGGKVVKNVTGYDLCKLFCGSRGTLGVIHELSFKVAPLPEQVASARISCRDLRQAEELRAAGTEAGAAWVELEARGAVFVEMGFEGYREDVASRIARIQADWRVYPGVEWLSEAPLSGCDEEVVLRIGVLPDRLVSLLEGLSFASARAHLGSGIARVGLASGAAVAAWRRAAAEAGGWSLLERGLARDDVYGDERPEWRLAHEIKRVFDPEGILSPGRGPGKR